MRLFVAVFPTPEVQRSAAEVIEALRQPGDRVSWVKPDNLHYTLRFIGEVGEDGARRVIGAAREAAAASAAFNAVLGGLGAFPNPVRPRVIWMGMTAGERELMALAGKLEAALERRGFEREGRAFSAHLTLGRLREPGSDWTARLAPVPTPSGGPSAFRVDRVCVVESRLSPKGALYGIREAPPLGA